MSPLFIQNILTIIIIMEALLLFSYLITTFITISKQTAIIRITISFSLIILIIVSINTYMSLTDIQKNIVYDTTTYELDEIKPNTNKYIYDNYPNNDHFNNIDGVVKSINNKGKYSNKDRLVVNTIDNKDIQIKDNSQINIIEIENIKPTITIKEAKKYKNKLFGIINLSINISDQYKYVIKIPK